MALVVELGGDIVAVARYDRTKADDEAEAASMARLLLADQVPEVAEMDCNPVVVSPGGAVVVDAKARLAPVPADHGRSGGSGLPERRIRPIASRIRDLRPCHQRAAVRQAAGIGPTGA